MDKDKVIARQLSDIFFDSEEGYHLYDVVERALSRVWNVAFLEGIQDEKSSNSNVQWYEGDEVEEYCNCKDDWKLDASGDCHNCGLHRNLKNYDPSVEHKFGGLEYYPCKCCGEDTKNEDTECNYCKTYCCND